MELAVSKRDTAGKPKKLRAEGTMPAVVYGAKFASTPISLSAHDFEQLWKKAGESTVLTLKGLDADVDVLIHEVSVDPILGSPRHADFLAIEKDKKVQVNVHLEFVNESPAVKQGGVLVKVLHELGIETLPANIPQYVEADISVLAEIGSQILVKDITVPSGVEVVSNGPDDVVALVSEATEEPEEAPAETADISAIEVEKKGKEKTEDGSEVEEGK